MPAMPNSTALASREHSLVSYSVLLRNVRQAIAQGRERAADAVERELIRTKWEAGKLILEHILLNNKRGKYGEEVLERLSKDLGTSKTELRYMVEFARSNSKLPHAGVLSWDKLRELLSINDNIKRDEIAQRASKENWSRDMLRREIKRLRLPLVSAEPASQPLIAKRGQLYHYQVVIAKLGPWKGEPVVDLGFSNYYRPPGKFLFKEGEIVASRVTQAADVKQKEISQFWSLQPAAGSSATDLFTYRVDVDEVTDGDTIWVLVDLGFGFTTKQCLRLRGLDCPEIATRDGQEAKRFVEKLLAPRTTSQGPRKTKPGSHGSWNMDHGSVIITSTKSDKYDRYLADAWAGGKYLNQELLDKGLAVRMSE